MVLLVYLDDTYPLRDRVSYRISRRSLLSQSQPLVLSTDPPDIDQQCLLKIQSPSV